MRLISQDGKYDVPYEQVVVCLQYTDEKIIIAYHLCSISDDFMEMAIYSSVEKAKTAMEMLQEAVMGFSSTSMIFKFPKDEELEITEDAVICDKKRCYFHEECKDKQLIHKNFNGIKVYCKIPFSGDCLRDKNEREFENNET